MTQPLPVDALPDDRYVETVTRLWVASLRGMADHVEAHLDRDGGIDGIAAAVAAGARGVPVAKLISDAVALEVESAMGSAWTREADAADAAPIAA